VVGLGELTHCSPHLHHQCTLPHASFWVPVSLRLQLGLFGMVAQLSWPLQLVFPRLSVFFGPVPELSFPDLLTNKLLSSAWHDRLDLAYR
jgi:hypothetical protein